MPTFSLIMRGSWARGALLPPAGRCLMPTMAFLERLARLNRTAVFLITLALFLAALFINGVVGGLVLLLLAAGLAVLTATTWNAQSAPARILKATVLVLLVITALTFIF